jgi:hypothetical protein
MSVDSSCFLGRLVMSSIWWLWALVTDRGFQDTRFEKCSVWISIPTCGSIAGQDPPRAAH